MTDDPIDGDVLLLTSAKASVGTRLPTLIEDVQADLGPKVEDLRRRYEAVLDADERVVFLVEQGFWQERGKALDI